jgi:predicted dehydrogenase
MSILEKINLGIVGACGRGGHFKNTCEAIGAIRVHAACDINKEALPEAAKALGASEQYTDYNEMLEKSELDAVIVGTPQNLHVEQSIAALRKGLHVFSEVPAGVSIAECRELVEVCKKSDRIYMIAENCNYMEHNVIVKAIVEKGLFGTVYYAEGEYLHEVKWLNEITKWRRKWQSGINGITYPTHSLGPILQWMKGERVTSVCCAGSGHHYRDPRGDEYENEDSCVMFCRMSGGGLVKIRLDMLSNRPDAGNVYQLQGTDGSYESGRANGERNRIWLKSRCKDAQAWLDLNDLIEEFLPEHRKEWRAKSKEAGHGGSDFYEMLDFVEAILGKHPCTLGIHEAMDMTLPGLASQQSIIESSRWVEVPDSREW